MPLPEELDIKTLLSSPLPEPEWLVPDLLIKGSMTMLCGSPGVGKSYFSYTLSIALATGSPFLGRPTNPSQVLYVDEENSLADLKYYIAWAWSALGKPDLDLLASNLHIMHFQLVRNPTQWSALLQYKVQQIQPVLVVIDTVTPACMIKEENDNGEANMAAQSLRRAQHASPGASMLLLKHLRDQGKGRMDVRGAKYWKGTVDSIIFHKRTRGHPRKDGLSVTRLEPEKKRAFGLNQIIEIDPTRLPDGAIILNPKTPTSD